MASQLRPSKGKLASIVKNVLFALVLVNILIPGKFAHVGYSFMLAQIRGRPGRPIFMLRNPYLLR